ncbi:MAG: DUF6777 domain-containing protein [Actinomycetota bacterium]|nr:DUF6777 domain-containing protein [Actinomycetota bacterium]
MTPVSIAAVLPQGMDELDEGVSALVGAEAGLYGGTKDNARCDADLLIDFLTNDRNSYKASAWAAAHDIDVDEIDDYIDGLTPMVLRQDLRVTNHGFRAGEATPFQAVLQAGTAVLVDDRGIPRVRCACGNPLLEPEAVASEVVYEGQPWAHFDEQALFRMTEGEVEERFLLVDLPTGDLFERPIGGDGSTDRFLGEPDPTDEDEVGDILVPDVAGLTEDDAVDELEARGLVVTIVGKADDEVEPGRVVITDPPAGSEIGDGDEVLVIVSTGPEEPPTPTTVDATTTTTVAVEETSTTSTAPPSTIIVRPPTTRRPTTQPPPPPAPPTTRAPTTTTTAAPTTTVAPTTTTTQMVPVPDVSGLLPSEAQEVFGLYGLVLGQKVGGESTGTQNLIGHIAQTSPAIGTPAQVGSVVNLIIYDEVLIF